jgi:uncharacterized protein (TIGR03437 family)
MNISTALPSELADLMRPLRSIIAILFCCCFSSFALADTTLLDKSGWVVVGADDTGSNRREVVVSVEGQPRGRFTELRIHYQIANEAPQVFSVKGNGALRAVLPPPGQFGGTFYAAGYWDCERSLVQTLAITELNVEVEPAYPNLLKLSGKASNLSSFEAADFTLRLQPPSAGVVRAEVSYTLMATRAFCVDQTRQAQREGFRLARIASSFISNDVRDSDQAVYLNSTGAIVRADLRNESGFIFASPQPLGKPRLELIHRDAQPRNTPTLSIIFSEPALGEITPQGFVTRSNDPNDDNVDLWGNWDKAKAQYAAGERIGRFAFTLEATPPGTTPPSFDQFPPIKSGEFVTRATNKLMLGNREFRFAGNNAYYLQPEIAYANAAGVREALDDMVTLGLSVARTIGFNDHPVPGNDPAVIQTAPGQFNEENLKALDRAVAEARLRNIRLIVYLTNNFPAYGGIRRYVQWFCNCTPADQQLGLFYTEPMIKQWFKNYITMLLNRTNTVTGVRYKDEPAILAWELGNELRNQPANAAERETKAQQLLAWMAEISGFIKSVDQNHLVADGGEGFDDDPSLYSGLSNSYAVRGDTGNSFRRMLGIATIDLASYHLYPASWGLNDNADVEIWIRAHERLARAAGKVAYLGEYGKRANDREPANCDRTPGRSFDPARAQIYDRWLAWAVWNYCSTGHTAWQLFYDARPDCDGFAVYYPEDRQTIAVWSKYSATVTLPPAVTVSAASFRGEALAAESIASVFGSGLADATQIVTLPPLPTVLAGARVLVRDGTGTERAAPLFFVSPNQINFQLPAGTASGVSFVSLRRGDQFTACGATMIETVAPGLFTANASGQGVAAAVVLRIKADGTQSYEPVAQFDPARNQFVAAPIDLGPETDLVFLILYGTGSRNRSALAAVSVALGGVNAEVLYAAPQGDFVGLDQSNVRLPRSLMGRGEVDVVMTVDGKTANVVRISVK